MNESSVIQCPVSQLLVAPDGKKTMFHRKGMAVLKEESAKRFGINPGGELEPPMAEPSGPGRGEKKPSWSVVVTRAPRGRGPGDPQDFARRFGLFSFYFIYGANKDYVLVGTSNHFEVDRPQDVVCGWLHKSYHCPWDSRIGFEWRSENYLPPVDPSQKSGRRRERGFVFGSAQAAEKFDESPVPWDDPLRFPPGAIDAEKIDPAHAVSLTHTAVRMLLIESRPVAMNVYGSRLWHVALLPASVAGLQNSRRNDAVQPVREGFVWSHARKAALADRSSEAEQLRKCVLISKPEIDVINKVLGTFVGIAEGTEPAGDLSAGNVVRRVVSIIFGEENTATSVQAAFEVQWAIPFESDLLKASYDELKPGMRFPPKEVMKLKAARGRLLDILAKVHRTWKVEKDASGKYQAVPLTQEGDVVERGFLREGDPYGLIWYWVRQEELP